MRQFLKKNVFIYRTGKLLRDLGQFPKAGVTRPRLMAKIWKIYPKTMLPPVRLFNFADAIDDVNAEGIKGDVIECGVWSGGALALAALWHQRDGRAQKRNFIGLDSFEGLPPPTPEDGWVLEKFNEQSAAKGRVVDKALMGTGVCVGDAADVVRQFFRDVGVRMDAARFYPGWFQETLPTVREDIDALAILRIDGDWYESTKVCLDQLYDQVSPNGYIIIDDYGTFSGCQQAVDEFRTNHGITAPLTFVDKDCVFWRKLDGQGG